MDFFFIFLQSATDQIKHKIETAPDKGYEIGIAIGSFLPMIIFIVFIYWIYKNVKNRNDF